MVVMLVMAARMCLPRRVPNLPRFTRSGEFGELQSAAAWWTDRNVGLIEEGAPWLDRVGGYVFFGRRAEQPRWQVRHGDSVRLWPTRQTAPRAPRGSSRSATPPTAPSD
jgi:hypothetical protein